MPQRKGPGRRKCRRREEQEKGEFLPCPTVKFCHVQWRLEARLGTKRTFKYR